MYHLECVFKHNFAIIIIMYAFKNIFILTALKINKKLDLYLTRER